jgi:anaerobic magnesium-protoporphyrin IX monomethyl ester cyclase
MNHVARGRVLLLHPPYSDYTAPYHSLSYVAAPLIAAGYRVEIHDISALWFRKLFRTPQLCAWADEFDAELESLNAQPALSLDDQRRVIELVRALGACRSIQAERAVEILQGPLFYDWSSYQRARQDVRAFEHVLGSVYPPYDFAHAFSIPPHEPSSQGLVAKALASARLIEDLAALLRGLVTTDEPYVFCGITVPYSANLLPALALSLAVRAVLPGVLRVVGGTAISDVYKYRRDGATLANFASACDLFYIGEAEPQLAQLAAYCDGRRAPLPSQAIALAGMQALPERLSYVALAPARAPRERFVSHDWRAHPPYYGWIDWDLYLSPERRVLYSPARGCFWNQCTFCDYGLNEDGPTAPSRQMEPQVVVDHLQALAAQGVRRVYMAADAIAPKFLEALALELERRGCDLRWSCQLFLTKNFDDAFVATLQRAGLTIVSFGLESGSARVLELMGKGRDRVQSVLLPALSAFRRASIALQPLFFFGFPGETDAERQQTVDLLNAYRDVFAPISKGGFFTLLAGSILAKQPARFGLLGLRTKADDDILWELDFDTADGRGNCGCSAFREFNDQLPHCDLFERPWAGGIDTLHSQLYVEAFGRGVFDALRTRARPDAERAYRVTLDFNFDVAQINDNVLIVQALERDDGAARTALRTAQIDENEVDDVLQSLIRTPMPRHYTMRLLPHREI